MRDTPPGVLLALAAACAWTIPACGDDGERAGAAGGSAGVSARAGNGADPLLSGAAGAGQAGQGTAGGELACESVSEQVLAEELPVRTASLARVAFTGDIPGFVDAALEQRYPFGLELVLGARREVSFGDCSVNFAGAPQSAADLYAALEIIVHECGHVYDAFLSSAAVDAYELTPELSFRCERGDTVSRGGDTFARSRIASDAYQALRPPCNGVSRSGCDPYADVYLDGDAGDAIFQSGDQGFNLLMEEAVQYVNSIATAWAFADRQPLNVAVSSRDGILTFLWYIERYLRMARTEFPGAYERITADECWRELTLGVWARAARFLQLSRNEERLGIADDELLELVQDPELLEEIERLRALDDCP